MKCESEKCTKITPHYITVRDSGAFAFSGTLVQTLRVSRLGTQSDIHPRDFRKFDELELPSPQLQDVLGFQRLLVSFVFVRTKCSYLH